MKLGELFVTLGVNAETIKVKEFAAAIGNTAMSTVALVAGLAGVSYGFQQLLSNAMDTSVEMKTFADTTGLSAQELQKWQLAAERAFVAPEVLAQSLTRLQDIRTRFEKYGEGNIRPFNMIGVDPRQDPFAMLMGIRQGLRSRYGADKSMQRNILQDMGLSPELMKMFALSDAQLETMGNRRLVMNQKEMQSLNALRSNLIALKQEFEKGVFKSMGDMAPQINKLAESLVRLVGAVGKLIEKLNVLSGLSKALDFLSKAAEIFSMDEKSLDAYMRSRMAVTAGNVGTFRDSILGQFISNIFVTQNIVASDGKGVADESSKRVGETVRRENERAISQLRSSRR